MSPTVKIHVVSSRNEITQLNPREKVVHLVAPPTFLNLLELINGRPRLEAIEVHPSRFEKLSEPSLCLLKVQGVTIFPGVIQGHRTDLIEYYSVDEGPIIQRAEELQIEGLDAEDILAKVGRGGEGLAGAGGVHRRATTQKDFVGVYIIPSPKAISLCSFIEDLYPSFAKISLAPSSKRWLRLRYFPFSTRSLAFASVSSETDMLSFLTAMYQYLIPPIIKHSYQIPPKHFSTLYY